MRPIFTSWISLSHFIVNKMEYQIELSRLAPSHNIVVWQFSLHRLKQKMLETATIDFLPLRNEASNHCIDGQLFEAYRAQKF